MLNFKEDLSGKRFGRLIVVSYAGQDLKGHSSLWDCRCDCGKTKIVRRKSLKNGETTSCGCYSSECTSARFKKHGFKNHRLYIIWKSMRQRCNCITNQRYHDYGGRGITICQEWDEFTEFYSWAMANGYNSTLTIERKEVNGNYCPENCTWILPELQSSNRRNNHRLTFDGQTKTISEWSRDMGGDFNLVYRRIKRGWPIEEALTIKNRGRDRHGIHWNRSANR